MCVFTVSCMENIDKSRRSHFLPRSVLSKFHVYSTPCHEYTGKNFLEPVYGGSRISESYIFFHNIVVIIKCTMLK